MEFHKYHGLGNDYLVLNPKDMQNTLSNTFIKDICHRNYGVGADGILFGPTASKIADFALKIYNSDGSEAETSGNGLRIFSRYLYDINLVKVNQRFSVETLGGIVYCTVLDNGQNVKVEMGVATVNAKSMLKIDTQHIQYNAVNIGNPHCVIQVDTLSKQETCYLGPQIEAHPLFPNKTNVQFVKIIDKQNIQIEIWERGSGYTLSSGSSSCAAAVATYYEKLCSNKINVHTKGGVFLIEINENLSVQLTGPVDKICKILL